MEVKEEFLEKLYRRIFDLEGELRDAGERLDDARKALKARDETHLKTRDDEWFIGPFSAPAVMGERVNDDFEYRVLMRGGDRMVPQFRHRKVGTTTWTDSPADGWSGVAAQLAGMLA